MSEEIETMMVSYLHETIEYVAKLQTENAKLMAEVEQLKQDKEDERKDKFRGSLLIFAICTVSTLGTIAMGEVLIRPKTVKCDNCGTVVKVDK